MNAPKHLNDPEQFVSFWESVDDPDELAWWYYHHGGELEAIHALSDSRLYVWATKEKAHHMNERIEELNWVMGLIEARYRNLTDTFIGERQHEFRNVQLMQYAHKRTWHEANNMKRIA